MRKEMKRIENNGELTEEEKEEHADAAPSSDEDDDESRPLSAAELRAQGLGRPRQRRATHAQ